jgi:putative membrane protein
MRSKFFLGAVVLTLAGGPAGARSADAAHFIKEAMQGDNSEVMLGRLAAEKGASPDVRAYGQTLQSDHAQARADAGRVATQLGVRQSDDLTPEAVKERAKLEGLSGPAFDREFASYMVKDHTKDIADYRRAAKLQGPAGELARSTLPTLQKHLAMAKRLQG